MFSRTEIEAFLYRQGVSRNTAKGYAYWLDRAQRAALDLEDPTQEQVDVFMMSLPNTYATQNAVRSAIKLWQEGHGREELAIRVPRLKLGSCRAVDDEDARQLARMARLWRSGPHGVAVMLGLYQALRRAEIAATAWRDIDLAKGTLHVLGKGSVDATLPLHPELVDKLEWWRLQARGAWLFESPLRPGQSVQPRTVARWVRILSERAGVPITTHVLRHTCLAVANDGSKDLRAVMEYARHARPETTARYTRVTRDRMSGVLAAIDYD